ncbi:pentapeptide repeat-containing protein, partial [Achromobacter aegrifaciens]|uniref:pentapeptide repeat-containing protein n=1 Tax=Achromobacter aegrifaciens TaxID=1287736 RepID=UPI001FCB3BEA
PALPVLIPRVLAHYLLSSPPPPTPLVGCYTPGARLRNANLINSLLGKAILLRADLTGANLFRADVAQAQMDGSTGLDDAHTQGAKLWPARQPENAA